MQANARTRMIHANAEQLELITCSHCSSSPNSNHYQVPIIQCLLLEGLMLFLSNQLRRSQHTIAGLTSRPLCITIFAKECMFVLAKFFSQNEVQTVIALILKMVSLLPTSLKYKPSGSSHPPGMRKYKQPKVGGPISKPQLTKELFSLVNSLEKRS